MIVCPIHGEFEQTPYKHTHRKQGCNLCSNRPKHNTEQFIKKLIKIHGDKYNYDKVEYVNQNKKIIVTCPKHGDFLTTPLSHYNNKRGCSLCNGGKKLTREQMIMKVKEIHGDKYNYDKFIYINYHTPSIIICPEHGEWNQNLNNHINSKKGCPHCHNKTEGILNNILKKNFNYEIKNNLGFDWCKKIKKLRYDFIIEDLKCIIELDGIQHFKQVSNWKDPENQLKNDIFKNEKAMENGYTMIRVLQTDVFDNNPDTLLKLILSIHKYQEPQLICIGDIYVNRFSC